MKKALSILIVVIMVITALMGCSPAGNTGSNGDGDTAIEEGKEKKIAILFQHRTFKRYLDGDTPAFEAACREYGYEPIVLSAEDDSEKQIRQAESALMQGVSAIVLQPLNFKAAAKIVEIAREENVPVISYNELLEGALVDGFVGRNSFNLGYNSAQEMIKLYPEGNYIIAGGDEGAGVAREMIAGYKKALEAAPNITVVSEQFNKGWAAEGALKQVESALIANNDKVAAVLANNDGLATGALQALAAVGLNGKVGLSGQDLELAAAKAIANGEMSFTAFTDYKQMARDAVDMAVAIIEGKELPKHTTLTTDSGDIPYIETNVIYVNKDNLDQFLEENSWWITKEEVYN